MWKSVRETSGTWGGRVLGGPKLMEASPLSNGSETCQSCHRERAAELILSMDREKRKCAIDPAHQ